MLLKIGKFSPYALQSRIKVSLDYDWPTKQIMYF